ncbi:MAG: hypothetical protein Kow0098_05300 [Ignavibacteriaceae bacterium]
MKLNFAFITLLLLVLSASCPGIKSQTVEELISLGDKYTAEFNNQKALDTYLQADQLSPDNWEIYWRISRAYVDIGEHMPSKGDNAEEEQLKVFEKALSYADNAVKFAPDMSVNYVRRAIANGRIALFKGVFSVAGVVNQVRDDCLKAIELGNGGNYVQALAHYVLGRTHAKVSEKWAPARAILGLGWGDLKEGIKEMNKAVDLYPGFIMFYLDLAKAYIEDDQYDAARNTLNKLLTCKIQDEDDAERLVEAKKLLNEIKDE